MRREFSKKGQLTIFIILGLVVLFIFFFLILLVVNSQKQQLQQSYDNTFTGIIQPEAMRIYVNDCLADGLEDALVLIGKQGRLWYDQGGITPFTSGYTGIKLTDQLNGQLSEDGDRVFYGIVKNSYTSPGSYPESYPCKVNLQDSPDFCQYNYPSHPSRTGFGLAPLLTTNLLAGDLRRYLTAKTKTCVMDYMNSELDYQLQVEPGELKLDLTLSEQGVRAKVSYPLSFSFNEEDHFTLRTFDFFYDTKFYTYILKTVISPLLWDQQFADFSYSESQLKQNKFSYGRPCVEEETPEMLNGAAKGCISQQEISSYSGISNPHQFPFTLEKKVINSEGDMLFEFSYPAQDIIPGHSGQYIYRIARQNRPPALNYIHNFGCLNPEEVDYDYLLIKDFNLADETVDLLALDPDDDAEEGLSEGGIVNNLIYEVESDQAVKLIFNPEAGTAKLDLSGLPLGFNKFTVTVREKNVIESKDWQTVIVYVAQEGEICGAGEAIPGETPTYTDLDGDTFDQESGLDCDDNDLAVHDGAMEYCDSKDNDCDGSTDEDCGNQ
ncbi:MAG TPA: putative metal-binding motif-containing protein [Candidatus Nanoarchaeia archaeon]|nr:putative metal-binding motif-containing protein [Candidatus Nanoarchaeia archaeon]